MRTLGIIAEYNPIHNGHIYQIEKAKLISKADFVVVVMSGDFTQRGEPAIIDKWKRAELACRAGADLVLEMPFLFATSSAEGFAAGGVGILENLGVIDAISFGAESNNMEDLQFLATFLRDEPPEFKAILKKHLDLGLSFPKARELAVNECLGIDAGAMLKWPNNILAIEYLKHIVTMTPVAIKRTVSHGDEMLSGADKDHSSATAIRSSIRTGKLDEARRFLPENVYSFFENYKGEYGGFTENYYNALRSVILRSSPEELAQVQGMSEGIENKIKKEIRNHSNYEDFASALKSKRFTRTAIDRLMTRTLIGVRNGIEKDTPLYTRVLAFKEDAGRLLKEIRENAGIPVVTNINKHDALPPYSNYDIIASDMYNLICRRDLYGESDYVKHPCKITESSV